MNIFPSRLYWCNDCELTTSVYRDEYVRCKICGGNNVVSVSRDENMSSKLNFDMKKEETSFEWTDDLVKEFLLDLQVNSTSPANRTNRIQDFKKAHPFGLKTEDGHIVVDDWVFAVSKKELQQFRVGVVKGLPVLYKFIAEELLYFRDKFMADRYVAEQKERRQAEVEQAKKKYPEGILRISFVTGYTDSFGGGHPLKPEVYQAWVNENLKSLGAKITMVKNTSGEVLRVGMETNFGKIYCFKIVDGEIFVGADKISEVHGFPGIAPNMNEVHPVKKVLFKTEDGYDVTSDTEMLWWIDGEYNPGQKMVRVFEAPLACISPDHISRKVFIGFKEKENAEKYIEDNKPQFSKKQILSVLSSPSFLIENDKVITFVKCVREKLMI